MLRKSVLLSEVIQEMNAAFGWVADTQKAGSFQCLVNAVANSGSITTVGQLIPNGLDHWNEKKVAIKGTKKNSDFASTKIHELRQQIKRVEPLFLDRDTGASIEIG
jgi:hypothetical protein